MARMIRHEATGPIEIPPQEKSVWVCACGLSQDLPHCDGSHKLCKQGDGEAEGKLYVYNRQRTEIERSDDDA